MIAALMNAFTFRTTLSITASLVVACTLATPAAGQLLDPVPAINLSPFVAPVGQPQLRSANFDAETDRQWSANIALASHSAIGANGNETIHLDGETLRIEFEFRQRIGERWQLAILLPWISHQSGFLDRPIDSWHSLTGLADGQRDRQDSNRLRYEYTGSDSRFLLTDATGRPGDVRIELLHRVDYATAFDLSLRASIELPTGTTATLTGNDAVDLAVDVLAGGTTQIFARPLRWHTQLGVLRPGEGDLLPALRRTSVAFSGIGCNWQAWPKIALFAQANLFSRVWHSDLDQLGSTALELTTGVSWSAKTGSWYAAISEDLTIDRSPDIVFRLGWRSVDATR